MGKAWDVVGYSYEADIHCRGCMWQIAVDWADLPAALREEMKGMDVEDALDAAAKHWGIDRQDEHSFNSCRFPDSVISVFPKVIFESQACQVDCGDESCNHEERECWHDRCGSIDCGVRLCEQ